MTDKVQKIIAEIKDRISNYQEYIDSGHDDEEVIKQEELKDLLIFIDSLQEESVSEEFEKALAEEWQGYVDRGAATVDALEDNTQELAFAKGFYRGANWQKKQMIANAVDGEVTYGKSLAIPSLGYRLDKEGLDFGDKVKVIIIKKD